MRYVLLILLLPVLAAAGGWRSEVVDSDILGLTASYTSVSLEIGDDDIPQICFLYVDDKAPEDYRIIYYSHWNGSSWETDNIYTIHWDHYSGEYHSLGRIGLELDNNDNPIISWCLDGSIIYYYHPGTTYSISQNCSYGPKLCVDSSGSPCFCYIESDLNDEYLKYLYYNGSEWQCQTITTIHNPPGVFDFAIDSSGMPRFIFEEKHDDTLYYMYWGGSSWVSEPIDSGDDFYMLSFELDAANNPKLTYTFGHQALKYAYREAGQWHFETISSDTDGNDLALTREGFPSVTFTLNQEYSIVNYAFWNGIDWTIQTVADEDEKDFWGGSIALNSGDEPRIAYHYFCYDYEFFEYGIKYAWYDDYIFHLVWPENKEVVQTATPTLDWEDCTIPEHQSYTLWWGEDPDFGTYNEVTGINESEYTIPSGIEDGDRIYWRVKSIDDQGGEYWAQEMDWYFDVELLAFHLLDPEKGAVVDTLTPHLDWGDSPFPGHESYTLWWGSDPDFGTYNEVTDISESVYTIPSGIKDGDCIYWRVKSETAGDEYWAVETDWYFDVELLSFHLLEPEKGEVVDTLNPSLDWEDSPDPGHETYTLRWSTDPYYGIYNEVKDLTRSEYTIPSGIEDGDRIYWRVKSIDDEEEEYWAVELDWYFDVDLGSGVEVVDFGADATDEGVLVDWRCEGGEPAGVRVLRGEGEPEAISGLMPGASARYLDRGVEPGGSYVYWLEVIDAEGVVSRFGPTEAVSIPEETFALVLYAAYPSPSRDAVNFAYSIPEDGRVTLSVYDLSGRRIATPVDSDETAGRHEVFWNCTEITPGVYLFRLETVAGSLTKRLLISR